MTTSGMLTRAMEMMKDNRKAEAEALIRGFIDRNPNDPAAWALLARVVEDREQKLEALKTVLELKPDDAWAREYVSQLMDTEVLQRAYNLAKEGRQSEALYLVNQMLEKNPRSASAWMLKARLSKKKEETVHALREVLKLSPDNQQAKEYLQRIQGQSRPVSRPVEQQKRKLSWSLILGLLGLAVIFGGLCLAFTLLLCVFY